MKFRKKPVVIDAIAFTGDLEAVETFLAQWHDKNDDRPVWEAQGVWPGVMYTKEGPLQGLRIETLEGDMILRPGDYLIRGVNGEFYPCKPDIFAKTYEPVEAECQRSQ